MTEASNEMIQPQALSLSLKLEDWITLAQQSDPELAGRLRSKRAAALL